jgi:hypothetical protein
VVEARSLRIVLKTLSLLLLPLSSTTAVAQPTIRVFGGAGAVIARNSSDKFALPSDGRTVKPSIGAVVARHDGKVVFHLECDWPTTMTRRVPGAIKAGPVVYVITQRDLVASFLAGRSVAARNAARLNALGGVSLVRKEVATRYSSQEEGPGQAGNHLAWSGGVDLVIESGHLIITPARFRTHYITGIATQPLSGFAPARLLFDIGTTIGWRF